MEKILSGLKCTCIPMTRWPELPPRPAVLAEALEELSRRLGRREPGSRFGPNMQARTFWPEPRRAEPSDRDLDPDLNWVSAGRTAKRYLPTLRSMARSDAPGSGASPKRRGDLRCARGALRSPTWALRLPPGSGCARWTEGASGQTHRAAAGCTSAGILSLVAPHACSRVLKGGGDFPGDVI